MISQRLLAYQNNKLITSDFNEIEKSGWQLIANGQDMLNKPDTIANNFWFIESIIDNSTYSLVRVTTLMGQRFLRIRNAGVWGKWIEL